MIAGSMTLVAKIRSEDSFFFFIPCNLLCLHKKKGQQPTPLPLSQLIGLCSGICRDALGDAGRRIGKHVLRILGVYEDALERFLIDLRAVRVLVAALHEVVTGVLKLLLLLLKLLQLKNRKLNQLNNFTVILIRYRKGCSAKSGLFI